MRLTLPFPPSVNNLFLNVRGRGRVPSARYRAWRKRADDSMWGQKIEAVSGPVQIQITYEDQGRCDLDNLQKAILDHLVHHRLIDGDDRAVVRKITLQWGAVQGAVIDVAPA